MTFFRWSKSWRLFWRWRVSSPWAVIPSGSETAMPMRRAPTSRPRTRPVVFGSEVTGRLYAGGGQRALGFRRRAAASGDSDTAGAFRMTEVRILTSSAPLCREAPPFYLARAGFLAQRTREAMGHRGRLDTVYESQNPHPLAE